MTQITQSTQTTIKETEGGGNAFIDLPDEPNYSPFKNFEEDRIRNACRASDAAQRRYFETADMAHAICLWYWASYFEDPLILDIAGRPIDRTEAISLLKTFCRRAPSVAALNLERSRYVVATNRTPSVYGVEVASSLGMLCAKLDVEQRNCCA